MFCAISLFVTMFSKSCLVQRLQKASIRGKGLKLLFELSHFTNYFYKGRLDKFTSNRKLNTKCQVSN